MEKQAEINSDANALIRICSKNLALAFVLTSGTFFARCKLKRHFRETHHDETRWLCPLRFEPSGRW